MWGMGDTNAQLLCALPWLSYSSLFLLSFLTLTEQNRHGFSTSPWEKQKKCHPSFPALDTAHWRFTRGNGLYRNNDKVTKTTLVQVLVEQKQIKSTFPRLLLLFVMPGPFSSQFQVKQCKTEVVAKSLKLVLSTTRQQCEHSQTLLITTSFSSAWL